MPKQIRKQTVKDEDLIQNWLKEEMGLTDLSDTIDYKELPGNVTKRIKKLKGHVQQNHTLAKAINESMARNNGQLIAGDLKQISQQLSKSNPQYSESTYGAAISAGTVYVNRLKSTGGITKLETIGDSVINRIGLGQTAPVIEELEIAAATRAETMVAPTIIRGVIGSVLEAGGVALASEVVVPAILMGGFVKTVWDLFD